MFVNQPKHFDSPHAVNASRQIIKPTLCILLLKKLFHLTWTVKAGLGLKRELSQGSGEAMNCYGQQFSGHIILNVKSKGGLHPLSVQVLHIRVLSGHYLEGLLPQKATFSLSV